MLHGYNIAYILLRIRFTQFTYTCKRIVTPGKVLLSVYTYLGVPFPVLKIPTRPLHKYSNDYLHLTHADYTNCMHLVRFRVFY